MLYKVRHNSMLAIPIYLLFTYYIIKIPKCDFLKYCTRKIMDIMQKIYFDTLYYHELTI